MPPKPSEPNGASLRIFVRRGAVRRFNKLKTEAAALPVTVEWDRRGADRTEQSAAEAAAEAERRQDPPFTWNAADFVLVEGKPVPRPKSSSPQKAAQTRKP